MRYKGLSIELFFQIDTHWTAVGIYSFDVSNSRLFLLQILHISDVEVRETKMMGTSPIIILMVCTFEINLNVLHFFFLSTWLQVSLRLLMENFLTPMILFCGIVTVPNTAGLLCTWQKRFNNRRGPGKRYFFQALCWIPEHTRFY